MINELIEILKEFGISKTIIFGLMISGFIVGLISAIVKLVHSAILKNNQWLLNENLHPYFSTNDVDRATRYYVPTKYQNVSPTADEEPGKNHIAFAKELLMPMFLNKAFKNNSNNTKHYLILADAGMGKTTFLINLFLSYTSKPLKNLFGWNGNQGMKLFPLGSPDIWADIGKIGDKRNTILLLDAFDEDVKAVDDYEARMKEILEATKEFKEVVITCRTQFFPSDKEIPDDTGHTTFGGEQETYKFQRVYLSVFDDTDINKYLRKRFSFFQFSKRKKAFEIVKKSPHLVMRPMLLSYINDFVEANRTFKYTYEIYEVLIDKWIERESKKHGIRKKYGSEEKYRELLLNFSQSLAANLYERRDERGGYFVTKNDFIKDTNGLQITDVDNYEMTETEVRSKSLLNRNAEGKYKFSHKSILEYFLANELIQNGKFLSTYDFEGMSVVEMFLEEMIEPFRKLKGTFTTLDGDNYSLEKLSARDLSRIVSLRIEQLADFNLLKLSLFTNIEQLILFDKQKYKLLYDLYFVFDYDLQLRELQKRLKRGEIQNVLPVLKGHQLREIRELLNELELLKLLKLRERLEQRRLRKLIEVVAWVELRERQESQESLKWRELRKSQKPLEWLELRERLELLEGLEWRELKERLGLLKWAGPREGRELRQRLLQMNKYEIIKTLQPIEDFLKDMKLLQEKLPKCKMIY